MKKVFLSSLCLSIIFDDVESQKSTRLRLEKKGFKVTEMTATTKKHAGKPCLQVEWNQVMTGQMEIDAEIINLF